MLRACLLLQAHELMDRLKKNLRAEHVLIHEFLVDWYLHVCLLLCRLSSSVQCITILDPERHKCGTSSLLQAWT